MAYRISSLDLKERADATFRGVSGLLFMASALGTLYWYRSMSGGMTMPGDWTMSMMWMRMPGQTWLGATTSFMGMWVTMMVAMMLPSLVPMLSSYRRSVRATNVTRVGMLTTLAGGAYFTVWVAFGVLVYAIGVLLASAAMRWQGLAQSMPVAMGVVLLLAGSIQLSAWKTRQLGHCRDAVSCRHAVSPNASSAWQDGLRLGVYCCLCCASFMIILLVTGVMNLGVMIILAAALTLERLTPRPQLTARIAGFVILTAGALVIARALQSGL